MHQFKLKFSTLLQATALTLSLAGGSVMAQAWPSRPISLVVPFPAGGTTDVLARAVGQELSKSIGQPVIVESRPGAAATPRDIVTRLNTEIVKIINSPEFKKKMDDIGAEPIGDTPEQMAKQIKDDTERFAKLIKEAKVSIE